MSPTPLQPVRIAGNLDSLLAACAVYDHVDSLVGIFDVDGVLRYANPAFSSFNQAARDSVDALKQHSSLMGCPDFRSRMKALFDAGYCETWQETFHLAQQIRIDLNLCLRSLEKDGGGIEGYMLTLGEESVVFNRYHIARAQESLRSLADRIKVLSRDNINNEQLIRLLFRDAPVAMIMNNDRHEMIRANRAAEDLFGYRLAEMVGKPFERILFGSGKEDVVPSLQLHQYPETYEIQAVTRDNLPLNLMRSIAVIKDAAGKSWMVQGFVDLSARKRAEEALSLLATAFTNSGESIVIADAEARIIKVNNAFSLLTGFSEDEVRGKNLQVISSRETPKELFTQMWEALSIHGQWKGELWGSRKSGDTFPKWMSIVVVRDHDGRPLHYVASFSDVSERKAYEKRIISLAYYDALTKLPNRLSMQEQLARVISLTRRSSEKFALMLIDLDHFKDVNDRYGHQVGDQLLVEVARRMTESVRDTDIVARMGGDEFLVVLTGVQSVADVSSVADKLVQMISEPCLIDGAQLHTSPSIGICLYPDDGEEIVDLVKKSDIAMYHAKAKGRNNYQFFAEELNNKAMTRLAIKTDLMQAMGKGEFLLHYQPQLDIKSGRLVGVEALLRWQHPGRGMVYPDEFIAISEETGLIEIPLGEWIISEACRQMKRWENDGIADFNISVNLSATQFRDPGLPERIRNILADTRVDPGKLHLEITESIAMESPGTAREMMQSLADMGLSLSIDDFGTGYSSLYYLKNFPIHTLKIDRAFVEDIENNSNDADICDVIVMLAHKLGLDVVAEGVESEGQFVFLSAIGCDRIQGYFLSKPLPPEMVKTFFKNHIPEISP